MKLSLKRHITDVFNVIEEKEPFELIDCLSDPIPDWARDITITRQYLVYCVGCSRIEKLKSFLNKEIFQTDNIAYWFEGDSIEEAIEVEVDENRIENSSPVECLKTNTRLPTYIDEFIYNKLGAEYAPDFEKFSRNLNLSGRDLLKYLGTYFPRSYAESFCIFDNVFQNQVYYHSLCSRKSLNILSVGSGTGGEVLGLLMIINKYCNQGIDIQILSIDGNDSALSLQEQLINEFRTKSGNRVTLKTIKSVFNSVEPIDPGATSARSFDFILSFKLIGEIIAGGAGALDSSYYEFIMHYTPKLSDIGLSVLLDVTTKPEHTTYNPILLNQQVNKALSELKEYKTLLPRSCEFYGGECQKECFYQKTFTIAHSKHSGDSSKVAYRIISREDFVDKLSSDNSQSTWLINNNGACPYSEDKHKIEDAYLLINKDVDEKEGSKIEISKADSSESDDPKAQITNDDKNKDSGREVFRAETPKIQLKPAGYIDLTQFEKPKKEIRKDKINYYIIDTNVFIDCPEIISKIKPVYPVILSAKVIDELDYLKSKLKEKELANVKKALKLINDTFKKRDLKMETADLDLLPPDFDKRSPDNLILAVALKYRNENPILLTSDQGLQVKAKGMDLSTIGLKEFINQLKMR